ncbi:MAG: hydrogenase expression/formation protein HypE [Planctomycetes bacterium]|nr:hydrogenase expression/formation protein HypE [Planctomycetota bacterium]
MTPEPPDRVLLGHGSGGRLTDRLVREVFLGRLSNPALDALSDAAHLPDPAGPLAFTTDAFVVSPLFFPGGDIGSLCVNGTVNDLAVAGAVPLHLSAAFILEEGFPLADLRRIADSMAAAAAAAGVEVVCGDTKVVERGHGDGVFVTTAGIGRLRAEPPPGARSIRPGDAVIVSGPLGDHGAVILAARMGLDAAGSLRSDGAPVAGLVDALYAAGVRPRFLRDPTRGGLATVLAEAGREAALTAEVREDRIPVRDSVRAVCSLLGVDPLYLACEGRIVAIVPPEQEGDAVRALRGVPGGEGAAAVGTVVPLRVAPVSLVTLYGGRRAYDTLAADPLPRIC